MIKLGSGFEILRFSDAKHEKITSEIGFCYDSGREPIAQLSNDHGPDEILIDFVMPYDESGLASTFKLSDFLEAVAEAKKLLD